MKRFAIKDIGTLGILFVLTVLVYAFVPEFHQPDNLKSLLIAVTSVGLLSCTMMFCLGTGDVDLSIGSICALASVSVCVQIKHMHWPVWQAVFVTLLLGVVVGLINGLVVAKFKVGALIATLATMQIVRGVAYLTAPGGSSVGVSDDGFGAIAKSEWLHVQAPIWYLLLAFIVFGIFLHQGLFGRNVLATGGNQDAAILAGINVPRVRIMTFVLQGLMAAFVGILLASRVMSGQPKTAEGLELTVISACVLGGVSLTGGVASVFGVAAGVLTMGVVQNAMSLKNIDTYWQYVVFGSVLLVAVLLDRLKPSASA